MVEECADLHSKKKNVSCPGGVVNIAVYLNYQPLLARKTNFFLIFSVTWFSKLYLTFIPC